MLRKQVTHEEHFEMVFDDLITTQDSEKSATVSHASVKFDKEGHNNNNMFSKLPT